jgi:hypothetical protein
MLDNELENMLSPDPNNCGMSGWMVIDLENWLPNTGELGGCNRASGSEGFRRRLVSILTDFNAVRIWR